VPGAVPGAPAPVDPGGRHGTADGHLAVRHHFFTALDSDLSDRLVQRGTPAPEADKLSSAVADSAGAMISGLGENPQTASAADAARDAMSHAIQVNGYTCAALLALGMLATLLIPRPKAGAQQRGEEHAGGETSDSAVGAGKFSAS
jgi:hypothetical protein